VFVWMEVPRDTRGAVHSGSINREFVTFFHITNLFSTYLVHVDERHVK
jgi:hypothetical protein